MLFLPKRKKPIMLWDKFIQLRSLNRGDALQLIQKANTQNLIKKERNKDYEERLSNFPFTVKVRP